MSGSNRISRFVNRYPFLGPALWTAAITFFVAQIAVAYNWTSQAHSGSSIRPYHPYSFFANTISDLGESAKRWGYGHPPMYSPDHVWMNIAFFLLGALMIVGTPLIYHEFTGSGARRVVIGIGFGLQALAGVGVIIVGAIPENTHPLVHEVGAALAIAVGTAGVLILGYCLPLPGRIRRFMLWCMPVSLVAILLYALHEYLGFGPGGMERVAAYPEVIWLIIFGFYIGQSHFFYGSEHRSPGRPAAGNIDESLLFRPKLPRGRVGESYRATVGSGLQTSAGAPRYALTEELHQDLQLSEDGVLRGKPVRAGLVRVPVAAATPGQVAEKTFTVLIRPPRRRPTAL